MVQSRTIYSVAKNPMKQICRLFKRTHNKADLYNDGYFKTDSLHVLETRKIIMALKTMFFTKHIMIVVSVTFRTVGLQTPYNALVSRLIQVGADDLDDLDDLEPNIDS